MTKQDVLNFYMTDEVVKLPSAAAESDIAAANALTEVAATKEAAAQLLEEFPASYKRGNDTNAASSGGNKEINADTAK